MLMLKRRREYEMNSKHAEKLLKLLQLIEDLGFKRIGVWLEDSVGRENLFISLKMKMELTETAPKKEGET